MSTIAIVFDNLQFFKRMKFQRDNRSSSPVHGTLTAMLQRHLIVWQSGDILSYAIDGHTHKFRIIQSALITDDHYEVGYEVESLSDCDVVVKGTIESCQLGVSLHVVLPSVTVC